MKKVTATTLTYDAAVGRIEPGQEYLVEDEKAERWIFSGIAKEAAAEKQSPAEEPEDEGDELPEDDDEGEHDEQLAAIVNELREAGQSQNQIAAHLGISRSRVRRYLAS